MSQYVNEEGIPLRGDGTPFPEDSSQWSEEEKEYLQNYYFRGDSQMEMESQEVAEADVPEIQADSDGGGSAYA